MNFNDINISIDNVNLTAESGMLKDEVGIDRVLYKLCRSYTGNEWKRRSKRKNDLLKSEVYYTNNIDNQKAEKENFT